MKLAILQVADTGPLESLVVMLGAAGWRCATCSPRLQGELRSLGCDTVLDWRDLKASMGYDAPTPLPEAGVPDMERRDVLYVDVKAHRNGPLVWRRWPHLRDRTMWYRINGGKPEHVINERGDHGDEINPPCPVLTPNQWYRDDPMRSGDLLPLETYRKSYCCWPPFARIGEYRLDHRPKERFSPPVCLLHNAAGWGYRDLFGPARELGVRIYGRGSPDGLLRHGECKQLLQSAVAMVHLKSNDAPGYAIYEAMASGCPVVCSQRLIWRCRMQELLEPGVTCLTFDHNETHDALTPEQVAECVGEIRHRLGLLENPSFNRRIGGEGRNRLESIAWSANDSQDVESLRDFLGNCFGRA